jgi:hypothetical protein
LNFWLSQDRFSSMEWHLFGDLFTRFIVTVQPIWDRKYRAWTCSVVEILGLESILGWHWTTQQVPNASRGRLTFRSTLAYTLYLVFKRLKHKSLLRCKAPHSHVFFFSHGLWFRAIKAFFRDSTTNVCEKSMVFLSEDLFVLSYK